MPPLPPLHARGALQFATQQHQQMQQQWDAAAGYATQQPNPFLYGPYVHPYAGQAPANMQPYATAAPPFYYPSPSPTSASPEYEAAVYAQHLAAQQLQLQQQRGFAPPTQAQSLYSTIRPPSVGFRHTESAESVDEQQYARSTKPAISRARSAVSTTLRPPQQPQPQQHSHAYPAPPDDDSDHDPHGDGRSASPSESESSGDGGGGGRGGGEEEGDGPGGVGEGGGEEGRNGYGTRRSHRLAHHPHSHTESQEDISGLRAVAVYNGWPNSHAAAAGSVASAVSSSSIASMRKAASAADFKSYTSPARNRTTLRGASSGAGTGIGHANANAHRNLGVLTTFYASGGSGAGSTAAGLNGTQPNTGSLNASGHGSSNSLSNMRVSTSHAALSSAIGGPHSISAASASSASASRALLSRSHSGVIPPLIPQFSLTSSHHYDGQPRRRRAEIAMVTDKLRDMQYEIGRLSRKIKEYEEDTEQWSLRYSRRIVILSNVSLGVWIFLLQFLDGIRTRSVQDTWLTRMFIPRGVLSMAKAASPTSASAAANSLPLSGVLISGFLTGVQSSILFLLSAGLQNRSQSWSRNTGFLLSTGYSLYLLLLRRKDVRPHVGNWFNVVSNFIYLVTRYYFLHGLLVFNSMRIL
jgi:hypothetical protein